MFVPQLSPLDYLFNYNYEVKTQVEKYQNFLCGSFREPMVAATSLHGFLRRHDGAWRAVSSIWDGSSSPMFSKPPIVVQEFEATAFGKLACLCNLKSAIVSSLWIISRTSSEKMVSPSGREGFVLAWNGRGDGWNKVRKKLSRGQFEDCRRRKDTGKHVGRRTH